MREGGNAGFPEGFVADGSSHLLLNERIEIVKPVTLIHGLIDATIPWQNSLNTAIMLRSADVDLHIRHRGDHRLATEADLEFMFGVMKRHLQQ